MFAGVDAGAEGPDRYWDAKLLPYVKTGAIHPVTQTSSFSGVWRCPSSPQPDTLRSYGTSQPLFYDYDPDSDWGYRWPQLGLVASPANVLIAGDAGRYGRLAPPSYFRYYYEIYIWKTEVPWENPVRHGKGANYSYCDGHAKFVDGTKLYPFPSTLGAEPDAILTGDAYCIEAKYMDGYQHNIDVSVNKAISYGYNCSSSN
jgi:prepilin-type processing-associated H-X9-DG protein